MTAFTRLDVHLLSWMDRPHPIRGSILQYASRNVKSVPDVFKTLQEACCYFEQIVNRVFLFLGSVPKIIQQQKSNVPNGIYDESGNQFVESPAAAELRRWSTAFKPIFVQCRSSNVERALLSASLLRSHALTFKIALRSAFFDPREVHLYGVNLPEYCEIVALCREVADHPQFSRSFVFDTGIVSTLFVVVTKCLDLAVRKEALSILKMAMPRREGVWDSSMVFKIGEDLIRLEEGGELANMRDAVEVHLNYVNTTFQLPKPKSSEQQSLAMLNYFCDYMADQRVYWS